MTKIHFTSLILFILTQSISASCIWHHPDSLVVLPQEDSVAYMEDYTCYSVLRSADTVSAPLWSFVANDTIRYGVLTDGVIVSGTYIPSRHPRDFSQWSVYAYHSGIRMDSTLSYTFRLDSGSVEMEELVFIPGSLTRRESAAWQSYLAMKYGITLDYAPYIAPNGDTLWSEKNDDEFYHRVVAIGADSAHLWQTSQSASKEHATIQLVAHTPLREGQYILLGDNDGEESWSLQADGSSQLLRTWRMKQHNIDQPFSIVWHPTVEVTHPDSVVLKVINHYDVEQHSIHPDSIVGDSAYWFTCPAISETMMLQISTIEEEDITSFTPDVVYNTSSGTIAMNNLDPDKIYSYALYTHVGQLLFRPSPSRPDAIHVGNLPAGVYRIEAFENNQIAASAPLVVH